MRENKVRENRELIIRVSKQLQTVSDFLESIEKSISIQVDLAALEPQLRTALASIKESFESIQSIYQKASQVKIEKEQEKSSLTTEIQQLKEKVQQLSSLNEELQKPKKRKTKSK